MGRKVAFILVPLVIGFILGLAVFYFFNKQIKPDSASIVAIYKGNLPCADCSGISATIKFLSNHTYQETYVYEGKNTSFTANGYWMIVKGIPSNPTASAYQLSPYGESSNQFYEILSDNKIQQLDSNRNPISSPFDLSLTKQ